MEDDRIKTLVSMVGKHLRREFAVGSSSLPPAMREQLDRLQCLADAERLVQAPPVASGGLTRPKNL